MNAKHQPTEPVVRGPKGFPLNSTPERAAEFARLRLAGKNTEQAEEKIIKDAIAEAMGDVERTWKGDDKRGCYWIEGFGGWGEDKIKVVLKGYGYLDVSAEFTADEQTYLRNNHYFTPAKRTGDFDYEAIRKAAALFLRYEAHKEKKEAAENRAYTARAKIERTLRQEFEDVEHLIHESCRRLVIKIEFDTLEEGRVLLKAIRDSGWKPKAEKTE